MYTSNFVICCRYFSLQASHPLGFDDKTRFEVEGNICREEGPLPSCFAKTHHIAFRTIEKVHMYLTRDTKMWFSSKLPWLWKMVIWWIILIFKIFNFQRYLFFFQSYFPSFLQSEMYYKYLSELVSTVTIATDLPKQSKHKQQGLNSLQEYLLQNYF